MLLERLLPMALLFVGLFLLRFAVRRKYER
jgi:hypothetical protein